MSLTESKLKIIDDLLDAGNQCLIRFSNRNELASEHDKRVSQLYECFEKFFLHGLKENQRMFNLTRKMISNSLSNSPKNFNQFVSLKDHQLGFWQFVTYFLSKHEIERFSRLKHVKTSLGRSRSWLRSSLNEHTLERYLRAMLENGGTIVKQFYEDEAAIRDASRQSEILDLVSKFNSVLFASTIDNPNLNSSHTPNSAKGRNPSARQPVDSTDQQQEDNKPSTTPDSHPLPNAGRAMQSINENKEKVSLNSESLSRTNSSKLELNLPLELSRNSSYSSTNYQQDDANLEDKSDDEPNEPIVSNVLLTPIVAGNYSVTDQFSSVLTTYDEEEKVSDFSNQSCNTSCSSTPAFHSKELANFERTKRLFDKEFESIHSKQTSTRLLESRQFPSDQPANDNEDGAEAGQRPVFVADPEQLELEDRCSKLESQNKELKAENKLLKAQLMKYIDAISLLQPGERDAILKCASAVTSDPIEASDLSVLSEQINERQTSLKSKNSHPHRPQQQQPQDSDYAKQQFSVNAYLNYRDSIEYEAKLVQVAEMHGEIVEYNDRLHRVLMQKDATIKRLKDQLIELRGPLPETIQSDEDEIVSIASDSEHQSLQFSSILTQNLKPLINIWIPSAFLADQKQTYQNAYLGADQQRNNKKVSSHHVYQIYIRIKEEEWNCYRRYSQFYTIHQILKKKYPQISVLEFPPKKTIGNRAARFVQQRRKALEAYLRQAINILQNDNNIYDRNSLVEVLPFLSEKYVPHSKNNDTNVRTANRDNEAHLGEGVVQQQDYIGL